MKYQSTLLIISFFFLLACSDSNSIDNGITGGGGSGGSGGGGSNNSTWSIDKDKVFDGGPGKDGIPALLNPKLINGASASYLSEKDLVIGIKDGEILLFLIKYWTGMK